MFRPVLKNIARRLRSVLRLFARRTHREVSREGMAVQTFRGYGTKNGVHLGGRVVRQPRTRRHAKSAGGDVLTVLKRLFRVGAAGEQIEVGHGSARTWLRSGRGGYFKIFVPADGAPFREGWNAVDLTLHRDGQPPFTVKGNVYVPPDEARYVVVSDIDDTVLFTGVANKIMMLIRMFAYGARSREAFPGVGAFYRALHFDADRKPRNALLYVSRSPWALYEVLETFFQLHDIPVGPILFLRDWGVRPWWPIPKRARHHKVRLIEEMLGTYPETPFILIGDSGQHDPEVYAGIVDRHPGRILGIYIRDVNRGEKRREAIRTLARKTAESSSALILADDSFSMASDAASRGWITEDGLKSVLAEKVAEERTL